MRKEVESLVDNIIEISKDIKGFKRQLNKAFLLPNSVVDVFNKYDYEYKLYQLDDFPQVTTLVSLGRFAKGEFEIVYSYHLYFSKLAPVYKDNFRFKIQNVDPNNMTGGIIEHDEYNPMTMQQYYFYDEISKVLRHEGFICLDNRDLEEVLCGMSFKNDDMKFFNEQPNVDLIFFNDLFS